jgi:hypothetical protein
MDNVFAGARKGVEWDQEETRPLSDGSAYEQQLSAAVHKRDKASPWPQVRYLILMSKLYFCLPNK